MKEHSGKNSILFFSSNVDEVSYSLVSVSRFWFRKQMKQFSFHPFIYPNNFERLIEKNHPHISSKCFEYLAHKAFNIEFYRAAYEAGAATAIVNIGVTRADDFVPLKINARLGEVSFLRSS